MKKAESRHHSTIDKLYDMHWEETLQDWGVLSLVYFGFKWRDFIGLYKVLAGLDSQEEYVLEINRKTVMTLPALHSVNAWAVTRTSVSRNTRNSPVLIRDISNWAATQFLQPFILCIYLSKGFLQNGETLKA